MTYLWRAVQIETIDYVAPLFHEKTLNFFSVTCHFWRADPPILNRAEMEDFKNDTTSLDLIFLTSQRDEYIDTEAHRFTTRRSCVERADLHFSMPNGATKY